MTVDIASILPQEITDMAKRSQNRLATHTMTVHGFVIKKHQMNWVLALEDESIKRLIIVAAPKTGKTPVVGLDYLGWKIGRNPTLHTIYVSNTASQANKNSVALRDTIIYNQKYKDLYGVKPDVGKGWGESEWFVKRDNVSDKDPTLQAVGIGGSILGATVELVVIDDPADPENMATAYQREKTINWLRTVPLSRMVPNIGRAIMICVSGDTEVLLQDGWEKIKDIQVGDRVWSLSDSGLFCNLVTRIALNGIKKTFRLKTRTKEITATANHPFLAVRNGQLCWCELRDLRIGDIVATLYSLPSASGESYIMPNHGFTDPAFMWLFGYLIGDGWITQRKHHPNIWITCVAKGVVDKFNKAVRILLKRYSNADCFEVKEGYYRLEATGFGRFLRDLGLKQGAKNKDIPNWVFSLPIAERKAFLRGLVAADGTRIGKEGSRFRLYSSSRQLVEQSRLLAWTCGVVAGNILSREQVIRAPHSKVAKNSIVYSVYLKFIDYGRHEMRTVYSGSLIKGLALERVKSIVAALDMPVYDLVVQDAHSFIGNGFVFHNCTRWHEEDPAAMFEKDGWKVVHVPAIDEDGLPTYPGYWTLDALEAARIDLGHRMFEMMFQGNVLPESGSIFKSEWWRYWKQGEAPWQLATSDRKPMQSIVQTWDTAHKEKQSNDYSACETWAVCENGYYLLNAWRAKMDYPKLKAAFVNMFKQFNPSVVLVEDAASGQDLIAELKTFTRIPVLAIKVTKDKVARANAVTPLFEAGKVFIPSNASWLQAWQYEHEVFPGGAHDDWVDTTTQFLNWARVNVVSEPIAVGGVEKKSMWRM